MSAKSSENSGVTRAVTICCFVTTWNPQIRFPIRSEFRRLITAVPRRVFSVISKLRVNLDSSAFFPWSCKFVPGRNCTRGRHSEGAGQSRRFTGRMRDRSRNDCQIRASADRHESASVIFYRPQPNCSSCVRCFVFYGWATLCLLKNSEKTAAPSCRDDDFCVFAKQWTVRIPTINWSQQLRIISGVDFSTRINIETIDNEKFEVRKKKKIYATKHPIVLYL